MGIWDLIGTRHLENTGSVARDHLANERTYLAWLRTALAFASIGVAVMQLFRLSLTRTDQHEKETGLVANFATAVGGLFICGAIIAKVHGSLSRAGRVKAMTPKVEKQEKAKKTPKGRAYKRMLYTRRFVNVTLTNGKRRSNPAPSS